MKDKHLDTPRQEKILSILFFLLYTIFARTSSGTNTHTRLACDFIDRFLPRQLQDWTKKSTTSCQQRVYSQFSYASNHRMRRSRSSDDDPFFAFSESRIVSGKYDYMTSTQWWLARAWTMYRKTQWKAAWWWGNRAWKIMEENLHALALFQCGVAFNSNDKRWH